MEGSLGDSQDLIYNAAVTCRDMFDSTIDEIPSGKRHLKELQQRFWAWSNNSGVFADPLISLDTRLQGHRGPQTVILRLLKLIQENLKATTRLSAKFHQAATDNSVEAQHESSQVWPEADEEPKHLKGSLFGISGALKRLNRLSLLISEASQNTISVRVEAFMEKRKMGFARFERLTNLIISNKYGSIPVSLKEQLARSIVYRRQRVAYQQHREARNQKERTNTEPRNAYHKQKISLAEHTAKPKEETLQIQKTPSRFSRPTTIDAGKLDQQMVIINQPKTESTTSVIAANTRYPRRPRPKDQSVVFVDCRFCFKKIEEETFSNLRLWRKHVDNDLMPLLCISEQCTDPSIGFSRYSTWSNHMNNEHGIDWVQYIHNPDPIWENVDHISDYRSRICPLCRVEAGALVDEKSKFQEEHEPSGHTTGALTEESSTRKVTNRRVWFGDGSPHDGNKAEVHRMDSRNDSLTGSNALHQKLSRHIAAHLQTLCFQILDIDLDEEEDDELFTNGSGSFETSDESSGVSDRDSNLSSVSLYFDDSDDGTDDDDLWELIHAQLIEPPLENGRKYLPLDQLRKLIVKPRVRRELKKLKGLDQDAIYKCAKEVCGTTKNGDIQKTTRHKMFAILVHIEHIEALPSLIDEGLYDVHLPFTLEKLPHWHLTYTTTDKTTNQKVTANFQNSYDWTKAKMAAFVETQWIFMSPFFDMNASQPPFYPLEARVVLPFLKQEKYDAAYGGFSTVTRTHIHEAHHNSTNGTEPFFAIKKLHSGNRLAFEQELHAMKKVNRQGHPYLIKLLATYQYQDHWYFIFPWANGNLREFWQRYCTPQPDHSLVVWIAMQVAGIASGLNLIQNPPKNATITQDSRNYGRHGDLKPENVLWFRNHNKEESIIGNGVLKIADFGLTRYHHPSSTYVNAQNIHFSLTYKAPEVDVFNEVSQAYDIWTLGCLLLEFVTWYLQGWQGVDEFSAERAKNDVAEDGIPLDTFYNITSVDGAKKAVLKPAVEDWIHKLRNHENCSLFFDELLTYILHHLLRVDPKERQKCVNVAGKLKCMAEHCDDDQAYTVRGSIKPLDKSNTMETTRSDAIHDFLALSEPPNTATDHNAYTAIQTASLGGMIEAPNTVATKERENSKTRDAHLANLEESIPGSKRSRLWNDKTGS